ncbi:hypothetical protein EJ04DRAFT_515035 [Polyplosphaeria fusca]|uniref:Uncharacterized protein n=1 Tax=Polyplosphaeria fusca TaxID=682080 RepID=A0A9P4UW71_9PLEO|nr:hypothetical protein EJ04DRAFT_515035 [Polyplosphaeria fusca]
MGTTSSQPSSSSSPPKRRSRPRNNAMDNPRRNPAPNADASTVTRPGKRKRRSTARADGPSHAQEDLKRQKVDQDDSKAHKMLARQHRLAHPPDTRTEGAFTLDEAEIVRASIQTYMDAQDLDVYEMVSLIQFTRPSSSTTPHPEIASKAASSNAFWKDMYDSLPDRTTTNIQRYVRRRYHMLKKSGGRWEPDEDNTLKDLNTKFPNQWKKIAQIMGDRSADDVRERWKNYLQNGDSRNTSHWTDDEENLLRQTVSHILAGSSELHWEAVSQQMGGIRSRLQCSVKWKQLQERDAANATKGSRRRLKSQKAAKSSTSSEATDTAPLLPVDAMGWGDLFDVLSDASDERWPTVADILWEDFGEQYFSPAVRKYAFELLAEQGEGQGTKTEICAGMLDYLEDHCPAEHKEQRYHPDGPYTWPRDKADGPFQS